MNYYPFHIGDYVSATRHLSWEEDAAFRRLLDTYYTTEKPIPVDLRAACRLVMAQTDSQREAVRVVLEEFFTLTDPGWVNKRADVEIQAMREKQQKQRDKANKRWHKPEPVHGNATASTTDATASKTHADAMPPTPTPTPTPTPRKEKTMVAPPFGDSTEAAALPLKAKDLTAEGVDRQLAADWLALRKAKRLPLTPTAWADTKTEGLKAGLDAPQTVAKAVANNWAGFKAAWLQRDAVTHKAVNGADVFDGVH